MRLERAGVAARAFGVEVSGEGIDAAMRELCAFDPIVSVALGQTPSEPRVERAGVVPGAWTGRDRSAGPFVLWPDAEGLAMRLNAIADPRAHVAPFSASDDPGAYFCDNLCVELAIDAAVRRSRATFLHVTAIDGVSSELRAARIDQYARQAELAVRHLLEHG